MYRKLISENIMANVKHDKDSIRAAQVAGSCRLEGIKVSREDEAMMTNIIAGNLDSMALRQSLVQRFKAENDVL
jgi:hypothetical protein